MNLFKKIRQTLINTFYPQHIKCICCKDEIENQNVYDLCENCYKTLPLIQSNFCTRCGFKFKGDGNGICLNCKSSNFYFDTARSAVVFADKIVNSIHKFKYAKYKFLATPFSYLLYDCLLIQNWNIDLICYVPLFGKREKQRGYNQSRELADKLSKLVNLEVCHDIIRTRDTPTQTKLTRKQRQENVKDCFKLINPSQFKNKNILLIDDVFTTGSTTNEISKILKKAGASKVFVLTLAHAGFNEKY